MSAHTTTIDKTTDIHPLPKAWLIVGLLWGVGCLNYLDRNMLATMRDSIKEAIPMGDDDFGALFTVFLVVYGVLSPVGGWCADRFSRSRVILFSLGVWSTVTPATAYAQTYEQLLATRVLMGISEPSPNVPLVSVRVTVEMSLVTTFPKDGRMTSLDRQKFRARDFCQGDAWDSSTNRMFQRHDVLGTKSDSLSPIFLPDLQQS
jgi:hypothetical protein